MRVGDRYNGGFVTRLDKRKDVEVTVVGTGWVVDRKDGPVTELKV